MNGRMKAFLSPVILFVLVIIFIVTWHYFRNTITKKETEHFSYNVTRGDLKNIEKMSDVLEANYDRITEDLKLTLDEKIVVRVYPSWNTYEKGVRLSKWKDTWNILTSAQFGDIRILTPAYKDVEWWNEDVASEKAVHSFVHALMVRNHLDVNKMPNWLSEGVAEYETYKYNEKYLINLKKIVKEYEIPNKSILKKPHGGFESKTFNPGKNVKCAEVTIVVDGQNSQQFHMSYGDSFSYTVIDFIINNYGYEKLSKIIRKPKQYLEILEIKNEDEFYGNWLDFLEENYLSVN